MNASKLESRRKSAARKWKRFSEPDVPVIYFGAASCGRAAGVLDAQKAVEGFLKKKKVKTKVVQVGCIGPCYLEPLMDVTMPGMPRISYSNVTPEAAVEIVEAFLAGGIPSEKLLGHFGEEDIFFDRGRKKPVAKFYEHPMLAPQVRLVLRNCGLINPEEIDHYIARDGYRALEKCLSMKPEDVLEIVKESGIRGRGGAGFPAWLKWRFCREAPGEPKYMIVNADEGDPGAFMDRSLIEGDPHAVLEGLLIAAYTIGASKGYVYIRAEYPLAIKRLEKAIKQMTALGLLGKDILGGGFDFEIKIKEGAGAFVCGEETALIGSIEGKRGMPRSRPPFPAVKGLFGKPTIINNVETLGNLPNIVRNGGAWYAAYGTETSKGTKTFSLVGKVRRTGLIEVPLGMTLREVVFEIGGGLDKEFKAVQSGGPSGGCLSEEHLDTPIDYENLAAAGAIMGSGGLIILDSDTCIVDMAKYFLNFCQLESCGKCVPCRVGTRQLVAILERICRGEGVPKDIGRLERLAETLKSGSLCQLGQTAANPVLSSLKYFYDEFVAHIRDKKCPAAVCRELVGAPCQFTCPVGTEAWRYIAHIARGEYEDAYRAIREPNPFPSVCARVCHHPCESRCRAGTYGGEPIAIRTLKRFVTDRVDPSVYQPKTEAAKGEKKAPVAVVGAGPAGLSAAHGLSLKGYKVTIFEADKAPGGMLVSGIPAYRLPREALKKEISGLIDANVTLKCNKALGRDFGLDSLFEKGFKAVFLAMGAHESRKLGIEGEDAKGVYPAMTFLKAFNLRGKNMAEGHVGVIGGGNSAIDAARVAVRQEKVKKVTIFYRRTREEMPAFEEEIEAALKEGIKIVTLVSPVKAHSAKGRLAGVEFIRNELGKMDSSGRRRPVPVKGTEYVAPLDTLIAAIGESPDLAGVPGAGVKVSKWGTVIADPKTLSTNRPGVFAGGDVVTGSNTVIDAIARGKDAAVVIDQYLRGVELKPPDVRLPDVYVEPVEVSEEEFLSATRIKPKMVSLKARKCSFAEAEKSPTAKDATNEARRCLRCDLEFTELKKKKAVSAGVQNGAK